MNKNSLDISQKIDNLTRAFFESITNVAKAENIPFYVIGASARDLILYYAYDLEIKRATTDIDLAVQVSSWEEFTILKNALLSTGEYQLTRLFHRLSFKGTLPVDIVPFGKIEEKNGFINWPPDNAVKMTVIGFKEGYEHAQIIRLRQDPVLDIFVASIPTLVIMKIVAWQERYPTSSKDALDLAFLLRTYLDAGNRDQLFTDKHRDLLEKNDFDYALSGARLLGRDIAQFLISQNLRHIIGILHNETDRESSRHTFAEDMTDLLRVYQLKIKRLMVRIMHKLTEGGLP